MGQAFGLYTHIRNNRWRSWFLLASLFVLVAAVTFALTLAFDAARFNAPFNRILSYAWRQFWGYLPVAFALAAVWVGIGFAFNTAMISWATGSQEVTRESHPRLFHLLETLCISRGVPVPKLAIVESPALNAFASGVNEAQYQISVTTGLMEALDDAELEAVLAHELTHIRNQDVRLMIIAVLIAGVISFFGELLVRGRFRFGGGGDGDSKGRGLALVVGAVIMLLAWFLAVLIRFSLSRSREYLADAGAVELTKNPDAMISALLKISGRADIEGVPSGIMDMCIENDPDDFADIFSTHPSITKRIQALQAYAGGQIPLGPPPAIRDRESLPQMVEKRGPWSRGGA